METLVPGGNRVAQSMYFPTTHQSIIIYLKLSCLLLRELVKDCPFEETPLPGILDTEWIIASMSVLGNWFTDGEGTRPGRENKHIKVGVNLPISSSLAHRKILFVICLLFEEAVLSSLFTHSYSGDEIECLQL